MDFTIHVDSNLGFSVKRKNKKWENILIMTKQEQNWILMTTLQIPWHHANKIEDEPDRLFLLNKAKEVQEFMQAQADREEKQKAGFSSIITPDQLG